MAKTIPFCFLEEVMQKIWQSDFHLRIHQKVTVTSKNGPHPLQQNTQESWLFQAVSINQWLVLDRHSWRVLWRCFIDTCYKKKKTKKKKTKLFQGIMEGTRFLPKSTGNNVHFRTTKTHKWTINKALENAAREKESRKREN